MKDVDYEKLEGLIFKAVQSGKQETSGLVDLVIHKIEPAVEKSIEKYVNGKIRLLDAKNDQHAMEIKQEQVELRKAFEDFKKEIIPQIQLVKDTQGFGKVSLYFLGFVSAIGGAILLVYNLFKLK